MFELVSKGDFKNLKQFMDRFLKGDIYTQLNKYGQQGVEALRSTTPVDSGLTSNSWTYEIEKSGQKTSIAWYNSNVNRGVNIAIILQFGHGTGTGGYVAGRDYINPAIQPTMDQIANNVWEAVKNA